MFKVKNKETKEIVTVLDVYQDNVYNSYFFFIWNTELNKWDSVSANNFVPPGVELEDD